MRILSAVLAVALLLCGSAQASEDTYVQIQEMMNDLGSTPAQQKKNNGKLRKCAGGGKKRVTVTSSGGGTTYSGVYENCREYGRSRDGNVEITIGGGGGDGDDEPRPEPQSPPKKTGKRGKPSKNAVLEFITTDSCTTSSDEFIKLEFYRQNDTGFRWGPFHLQYSGVPLHSRLRCDRGDSICFGAWTYDESVYWGCGKDCAREAGNACRTCEDTTVSLDFECSE